MSFPNSIVVCRLRCRVFLLLNVVVTIVTVLFIAPLSEEATARTPAKARPNVAKQAPLVPAGDATPLTLSQQSKVGDTGPLLAPTYGFIRVDQLIDEKNARLTRDQDDTDLFTWHFYLRSAAVANLKEGVKYATIPGFFKLTGKIKYKDTLGAAHMIDLVEDAPAEKKQKKKADDQPLIKRAPVKQAPISRTWTNAETGRQIEAEFVSMAFQKVKLRKADGTIITISIEKLSKEDQEWIQKPEKRGR
jgi:hypothetical protein